jgi:hypothetical protein
MIISKSISRFDSRFSLGKAAIIFGGASAILASTLGSSTPAQALSYNIGWTGSSGYTIDGSFSFDDNLANTGAITFADLTSFSFNVRLNGSILGTDTIANNFNFDTTTQTFLVGGSKSGTSGQAWGSFVVGAALGNGVGFRSNAGAQVIANGGIILGSIPVGNSTLIATQVPFEFSPVLGVSAIGGLWLSGKLLKNHKSAKNLKK